MKKCEKVLGVVCSTPRGFTSLLMNCSEKAVGEERIIGSKFGKLENYERTLQKHEKETDKQHAIRKYILEGLPSNSPEAVQHYKNMNPNGFYEHPSWTVNGVSYSRMFAKDLKELEEIDSDKPKVIKLVCTGLVASDPKYIKWVLYSIRHPWDVAKSQEDLIKNMKFKLNDGRVVDLFEGKKINDPIFYIDNIISFASWVKDNEDIPIHFIDGDNLIINPEEELSKIADFTGEDYLKAVDVINPKLANKDKANRREVRENIWNESLYLHECLLKRDFDAIIDYAMDKKTWFAKRKLNFFCTRLRGIVNYFNCYSCRIKQDKDFITNTIKHCETNNTDWENEPCAFECGVDPDAEDYNTIEESIEHNHWKPFKPIFTPSI